MTQADRHDSITNEGPSVSLAGPRASRLRTTHSTVVSQHGSFDTPAFRGVAIDSDNGWGEAVGSSFQRARHFPRELQLQLACLTGDTGCNCNRPLPETLWTVSSPIFTTSPRSPRSPSSLEGCCGRDATTTTTGWTYFLLYWLYWRLLFAAETIPGTK